MRNKKIFYSINKYLLDRFVSLAILIMVLPIFIFISFLIIIKMGKPVFFIQKRVGYKGKYIKIIKFRTMNNKKNSKGELLEDNMRLTVLGRFLRKTSIDEIPSFINVLKGDMSLVGPRPLQYKLEIYNDYQVKRFDCHPGITGWAQINGRNSISWDEKFDLDIWYLRNRSFILDLKILFTTAWKVFLRRDINSDEFNTMPDLRKK